LFFRYYRLLDEMQTQAQLAPSLDTARSAVRIQAAAQDIVSRRAQQIKIARRASPREIVIETEYSETVQLPLFNHTFNFHPRRRSRFSPPLWALAEACPSCSGGRRDRRRALFTAFAINAARREVAGEAFERLGQPAVMASSWRASCSAPGFSRSSRSRRRSAHTGVSAAPQVGVVVRCSRSGSRPIFKAMMRVGTAATAVAVVGVAVPFVLGFLYWRSGCTVRAHVRRPADDAIFVARPSPPLGRITGACSRTQVLHSLEARLILGPR